MHAKARPQWHTQARPQGKVAITSSIHQGGVLDYETFGKADCNQIWNIQMMAVLVLAFPETRGTITLRRGAVLPFPNH